MIIRTDSANEPLGALPTGIDIRCGLRPVGGWNGSSIGSDRLDCEPFDRYDAAYILTVYLPGGGVGVRV